MYLWYSKSIGKGLSINLQLIYLDKCHYEPVKLDINSNLTYSLYIFFWLHFSFPVLGSKPMGKSCQETNQKLNGHHLFPKGTAPCTPVLVINFKNQSHIPDTTVPFQSVCSPMLKVCSLRVTYIHPVHANLSGSVPSCQVSVHKLLTVELEVGKGPILNVFWTLQSAHSSLCFVAHQEKQPRENGEGAVAAF